MEEKKQASKASSGGKRKSVVGEVIGGLTLAMLLINAIGTLFVTFYSNDKMQEAEERYITEVVDNIGSTVDATMSEYIMVTEVLATNPEVVSFLANSTKTNTMDKQSNASTVLTTMQAALQKFPGSVELIALISVAQDAYITETGIMSAANESVASLPFYAGITQRQTVVTDPYWDDFSGGIMVSISSPVYSNGAVVGAVVFDLSIGFLSDLISTFGTSGATWIVASDNSVLAHYNASYIGQNYTAVGVSGSEFTSQMASPTGSLIEYDLNGATRKGSVGSIPALGWKLVAGMDATEFTANATELSAVLLIVQVISVCLALAVCAVSVYRKLLPLKEVNTAMREMSKGNLNQDIQYHSQNEIGELCDNLRTTTTNLAIYIGEIDETLSSFGDGDFTREAKMVFLGDFRAIQISTDNFVKLISSTLQSLKETVAQVSEGSGFVASGAQSLAEGSAKQSGSIVDLNGFIADITTQIQDNARSVDTANQTAQDISKELENSNSKMDEMMVAMDKINEKSEGITKIIKTIEDVAFQTNILALNAAVEAARAGSAGRGFAVVAEEVRNLSGRTNEAVKNTSDLIDETRNAIKDGNVIAETTIESLKSVTEEIVGFIDTLDEIAQASQQQAVALDKINSGVIEITDVMQTTSAVSEESAATSEELSSQAAIMKESIEQFKL